MNYMGVGEMVGLRCTCSKRRVPALRVRNEEQTPFACTTVHLAGTEVIIFMRYNALGIELGCWHEEDPRAVWLA